jgi:hypothetical protein
MKTPARPSLFAVVLLFAVSAAPICAQPVSRIVTVNTPPPSAAAAQAESEAIARGFEEAYRLMSHKGVFITYSRADNGTTTLADIRQVRATGGVLLITTERGQDIAIPARSVIAITTERPAP